LRDCKWFSVVDLKDGFYNVPIVEEDQEKTTFPTEKGIYKFDKLPQGFKNSPAIFQRSMTIILQGLIGTCCHVYIDDILIFGKTEEEHDDNFCKVLNRLREYNCRKINPKEY
jgi:hypothetical protein